MNRQKVVTLRRIVYQHTAGPYPGLRQILAVEARREDGHGVLRYLHTGETLRLVPGPLHEVLAPIQMPPDRRMATAMRLKTTDKYVVYLERPVDVS